MPVTVTEIIEDTISVKLTKGQIGNLVFQALEDEVGDADEVRDRLVIDHTIAMLDNLGLIVRSDG